MHDKTRRRIGDATLLLGFAVFLLGGGLLLVGYPLDVSTAALGALALLFVGVGSSMKERTDVPRTEC